MSSLARGLMKQKRKDIVDNNQLPSLSELVADENLKLENGNLTSVPEPAPAVFDNADEIWKQYHSFKESQFTSIKVNDIQVYCRWPSKSTSPVYVMNHGAGSSSMTFAKATEELITKCPDVGVVVYDMRGHGMSPNPSGDYSLNTLVADFSDVISFVKANTNNSLYLVGHSLGGAVAARYGATTTDRQLKGLVLLDIVEEVAIKSLTSMPQFVHNRPKHFSSITQAIHWHMENLLHNIESARLSVPDLLIPDKLTWKTDLAHTQPYWSTWFENLSSNFVNFQGPKLLVLSTHETLDKQLMIGQMQGKFQMVAFNNSNETGHFVHEDLPRHIAATLLDFVKRNENPSKFMEDELGIKPLWGGAIHK
ncbi:hypothetical protein DIURU_002783 [Diutina rugosa]|uniref:Protein phosphatase methylesterase 1 n=1 Tax=Diutina rugosa TaxID=5481 RepID=A0A642UNG4_DIURU|nr:uncharacterized protein DIURU_002783 [Diutina rugosa]KAA8902329.1 hypothetical protein DIURU_002783 [Diutina rugosa]